MVLALGLGARVLQHTLNSEIQKMVNLQKHEQFGSALDDCITPDKNGYNFYGMVD